MNDLLPSDEEKSKPASLLRWIGLLRAVCLPGTFFVMGVYWQLIYKGGTLKAVNFMTHGVNFVIMVLDMIFSRQSYPLAHGVYFLLYAIIVIAWSVIFMYTDLYRACSCSDDDDENGAWGCKDMGDDDKADECSFIYRALNWAPNAFNNTLIIVLAIVFVLSPILVFLFFVFDLCLSQCSAEIDGHSEPARDPSTAAVFRSKGFGAALSNEFHTKKLRFDVDDDWVTTFSLSRFSCISNTFFLCLRGGFFSIMLAVMLWSLSENFKSVWAIYITHWTLVLEVIYLGAAFAATYFANDESSALLADSDDKEIALTVGPFSKA
mmetsp:Transcript_27545/g.55443  ORF Transcript_27545/g.55443 Transcript_27545/m.55443 type:complete len:321 (+) Transcript_27545:143-1105(+)